VLVEEHKAVIRRLVDELWDKRNIGIIDEIVSPDWVDHTAAPGLPPNREGFKMMAADFQSAFSDIRTTIDDLVTEGDKVAWRWTVHMTHSGEFMGIPATGKQATLSGITIERIANGKMVERWNSMDTLGMLQQLGAIPGPA
jgi:predicted ester cyclase